MNKHFLVLSQGFLNFAQSRMFAFLHFYASVVSATIIILAQLVIQGGTVINWIGVGYISWWKKLPH
jgi:hypothetical protein